MKKLVLMVSAFSLFMIPSPSFSGQEEVDAVNKVTLDFLEEMSDKFPKLTKKERRQYKKDLNKTINKGIAEPLCIGIVNVNCSGDWIGDFQGF